MEFLHVYCYPGRAFCALRVAGICSASTGACERCGVRLMRVVSKAAQAAARAALETVHTRRAF